MKILLLTKDDKFSPARDIERYLLAEGHEVTFSTERLQPASVLKRFRYDIGISCHYRHIVKSDEMGCFRYGIVNIHPSMLPYGRGSDPVIWSMINGLPTGATFHWIDEGIDTGNILFQVEVKRNGFETGEELYERIVNYYKYIFPVFWDDLSLSLSKGVRPAGTKQELTHSPYHCARKRRELAIVGNLTGSPDLRILLALSNSKHNNLYALDENGNRYNIKLTVEKEGSL
jgi:hypothetical protein